jgi:hypothetical protein
VTSQIHIIAFLLLLPVFATIAVIGASVLSLIFRTRWVPDGNDGSPRG